jgi:HEPN domain-containing protein
MKNESLSADYFKRAKSRLKALDALYEDQNWADVVRESQAICELILKAFLRQSNIDPPRIHDVSAVLEENLDQLPEVIQKNIKKIVIISKSLRRDRELAFYGSEDLTPSEFYQIEDAKEAREWSRFLVSLI